MRHPSLVPLSHDHHHGLALALRCRKQALGQLKPLGAAGLRQRAQEFLEFYRNYLVAHFRAEEEVLFPLLRVSVPGSEAMLDELIGQHGQLSQAATRLETGTGLAKLIFDIGDLLERHIRKEERDLFPLFEAHIDAATAAAVGVELQKNLAASSGKVSSQ
ncbi:MAG: hemerythrin domain-containing protein [Deltaproteobacteria bacterium]|nr:hemerythrin domain-containing protein [Deltaproteobacteria bacterium]